MGRAPQQRLHTRIVPMRIRKLKSGEYRLYSRKKDSDRQAAQPGDVPDGVRRPGATRGKCSSSSAAGTDPALRLIFGDLQVYRSVQIGDELVHAHQRTNRQAG